MRYRSLLLVLFAGRFIALAAPPAGYYESAQGKGGADLRAALHNIIRNHHALPYSSSSFDTSDALRVLDQDPADSNKVTLIYSGSNMLASTFGLATGWNREHQWCNSYGIDSLEPAYSDLQNLRACDLNVNSERGNKYYDVSDANSPGYKNPAHAEAILSTTDGDSWEPPDFEKGDIARALFYMATRYTGDAPNEPALRLTDDAELITSTQSYMGKLSTLLAWNEADPVDAAEQLRNDLVYSLYQTNRNPFVDHPEWVRLAFAPPFTNAPTLNFRLAGSVVLISWLATNQSAQLEFSTNIAEEWFAVTNTPLLTNNQFQVLWTTTRPRAFFRLLVR